MRSTTYDPVSSTTSPGLQLRGRQASRLRIIAALAIAIAATLGFALTAFAVPVAQAAPLATPAQGAPVAARDVLPAP